MFCEESKLFSLAFARELFASETLSGDSDVSDGVGTSFEGSAVVIEIPIEHDEGEPEIRVFSLFPTGLDCSSDALELERTFSCCGEERLRGRRVFFRLLDFVAGDPSV